jgi:hypothetical protein
MKKFIAGVFIGFVCGALVCALFYPAGEPEIEEIAEISEAAEDFPAVPKDAIVFDLKYRGLSGSQDDLSYNSYWGFGGRGDGNSSFIRAVRKKAGDVESVYNEYFKGAEWSAVEFKNKKPIAFYFDLNSDGKLSTKERITPVSHEDYRDYRRSEFVTPDFIARRQDGTEYPFRAILWVTFYGQDEHANITWSPCCVLEGNAKINGKETDLILYTNGFHGTFQEFGRSRYALISTTARKEQYIPRKTLSSLINHEAQFYRVQTYGSNEKGRRVRIVLEKDTTPRGDLAVAFAGKDNLKAKLNSATITGDGDSTIQFDISGGQSSVPEGRYKLIRGYVNYGDGDEGSWEAKFSEGPQVLIDDKKVCKVEFGTPKLSVRAVDVKDRYQTDVKEKKSYPQGTTVYLSPVIKGKLQETYSWFSKTDQESRRREDIEPTVRVVDSEGKEIVSATMEYG